MVYTIKCDACGECCKNPWAIHLNVEDIKKIRALGYPVSSFVRIRDEHAEFKRKPDFGCVFLDKDNLCKIHKKHGFNYKAEVCQNFPYGEFVCGKVVKGKPAKVKIRNSRALFFGFNDKYISAALFAKLVNKIDGKKPLFEDYTNVIANILAQKGNILIDPIRMVRMNPNLSKVKKYLDEMFLIELSDNVFPRIDKLLGKDIETCLPTEKKVFKFKYKDVSIDEAELKKFLPYFKKSIKRMLIVPSSRLTLMVITYYLPMFSRAVAGKKDIKVEHMLKAFSLLMGLNRFGSFRLFKRYPVDGINAKFSTLIKSS